MSVGSGGFVGCLKHIQVRNMTVDVARGDVTSAMTQSGVMVGNCDVTVATWCHRPRICRHAPNDCLRDACDCNDILRRKFCLFCKQHCSLHEYVVCDSVLTELCNCIASSAVVIRCLSSVCL